jgi:hypothetical protein
MEFHFYIYETHDEIFETDLSIIFINFFYIKNYIQLFQNLSIGNGNILNFYVRDNYQRKVLEKKIMDIKNCNIKYIYDIKKSKQKKKEYSYYISPLIINSFAFSLVILFSWLVCFSIQITERFEPILMLGIIILSSFLYYLYQLNMENMIKSKIHRTIYKII